MDCKPHKTYHIVCNDKNFKRPENLRKIFTINGTGTFLGRQEQTGIEKLQLLIQDDFGMFIKWLLAISCANISQNIDYLKDKVDAITFQEQSLQIQLNECQLVNLYESWRQQMAPFGSTGALDQSNGPLFSENIFHQGKQFSDLDKETKRLIIKLMEMDIEALKTFCSTDSTLAQICRETFFTIVDATGREQEIQGLVPYLKYTKYPTLEEIAIRLGDFYSESVSADEILEYFSKPDADINHRFGTYILDKTLLMMASPLRYNDIVEKLFVDGADVNVKNKGGQTALILAIGKGNKDIVAQLINYGADVNITGPAKQTALIFAVRQKNPIIVNALLDAGANVNVRDLLGNTPLTLAVEQGNKAIVEQLLAAGADANMSGPAQQTPLNIAQEHRHSDISKILKNYGADVDTPSPFG